MKPVEIFQNLISQRGSNNYFKQNAFFVAKMLYKTKLNCIRFQTLWYTLVQIVLVYSIPVDTSPKQGILRGAFRIVVVELNAVATFSGGTQC